MTEKTFASDLLVGQMGESFTSRWFREQGHIVREVTHIEMYQRNGIDFLIQPMSLDKWYTVDSKTDRLYKTGNIFLETMSNTERGTAGCYRTSLADLWHYIFFIGDEVHSHYLLDLKKARSTFDLLYLDQNYKLRDVQPTDGLYHSQGYAVPIEHLLNKEVLKMLTLE